MKKLVILVLVLAVATAVFLSKKSEEPQEELHEKDSDSEEMEAVDSEADEIACEKAKKGKDIYYWKQYLKKFPHGKCTDKAKTFLAKEDEYECERIEEYTGLYVWREYVENFPNGKCLDKADKIFCDEAKKANTRAAWEKYLKNFPDGKCAEEGKAVRNRYKKIGNLEWSDVIGIASCEELEEDGHTDWRKPNIDELRLLVQNHPGTILGGKCKISEEQNKLDGKDETNDCNGLEGDNFSKFGDTGKMESSSKFVYEEDDYDYAPVAWGIDFDNGGVQQLRFYRDYWEDKHVRCVRQDDHDACETAKKYDTPYYWIFYFDNFHDGECAAEAKTVWENEDKKTCEEARKENTRAVWEKYLKKFPKGLCVEEGKSVRNKFKKIGGFEWSDISNEPVSSNEVVEYEDNDSYCHNLVEDGHSDWRLPTIDELRVLVQNHPGTVVGGRCKYRGYLPSIDICKEMKGNNFSKLGDKEELWSSSGYSTPRFVYNNSIDFSNGGFSVGEHDLDYLYVRCVRQDDSDACETARKEETDEAWEYYLSYFPKGKCAKEAEEGAKEDAVCERARKANTRAAWEEYLKKFPKGKCAKEGNAVRNKYKKIGNLEWSDVIGIASCEELEEDGHTDWREPNIDELRTLLQNHPGTVTGGKCRISELTGRLDDDFEDKNCEGIEGDNFSKLGDKGYLDSISSHSSRIGYNGNILFYSISFDDGEIYAIDDGDDDYSRHRCVRQDDHDACETAKKYNKFYYWKHYFENFTNGECADKAKIAMEKEDKKACEKARGEKDSDYWKYSLWKNYLRNFPNGKCAKEANVVLEENDKEMCEEAKEKNEYDGWKDYLREYPEGKCAEEAKKNLTIGQLEWSDRSNEEMNWKDAVNYCNNLKELGSTDWRLPDINELRTLIQNCPKTENGGECKVSAKTGCLSAACLKPTGACSCEGNNDSNYNKLSLVDEGWLWSSSTMSDGINSAWRIDFSNADVGKSYKVSKNYVRCVRIPQGKSVSEANKKTGAKKVEPEKVADKKEDKQPAINTADKKAMSGKNWSSGSKKAMSWKQAVKYCENLKENGSSDWQLPTISELRTLITECKNTETGGTCGVTDQCLSVGQCKNKACRGCESKVQHNTFGDKGFFWSSSISPDNKNAWYIDFTYGSVHNHSKSVKFVRCVR